MKSNGQLGRSHNDNHVFPLKTVTSRSGNTRLIGATIFAAAQSPRDDTARIRSVFTPPIAPPSMAHQSPHAPAKRFQRGLCKSWPSWACGTFGTLHLR